MKRMPRKNATRYPKEELVAKAARMHQRGRQQRKHSGGLIFATVTMAQIGPASFAVTWVYGAALDVRNYFWFWLTHRVDRGSAAQICPVDIRAHVFAADGAFGGALYLRASICWHATNPRLPLAYQRRRNT